MKCLKINLIKQIQKKNTLQKEGIVSASHKFVVGSTHGQSKKYHSKSAQERSSDSERRPSITSLAKKSQLTDLISLNSFLPSSEWFSLGDGWYQTTKNDTGSSYRAGLHSIIEAMPGNIFMCIYEPRSTEALTSCTSNNPLYDLEINAKCIGKTTLLKHNTSSLSFHVVFAFKSTSDYYYVSCDIIKYKWTLSRIYGEDETILAESVDLNLKINIFYTLLLQIRGNTISIDLNNQPLFTSIRLSSEDEQLRGIVGLLSKGSQFAVKGWKLRGFSSSMENFPSNNNSGSILNQNKVQLETDEIQIDNTNNFSKLLKTLEEEYINKEPPKIINLSSLLNITKESNSSKSISNPVIITSPIRSHSPKRNNMVKKPTSLASMLASTTTTEPNSIPQIKSIFNRLGEEPVLLGGGGPSGRVLPNPHDYIKIEPNTAEINNNTFDSKFSRCTSILIENNDKNIVDTVMRDVVQRDLGVSFDDIAALSTAKRLLNEAIVLPLIMPEFFTGIRKPWKGVLLFGSPGTGKTLLAKAVCGFNNSTFFSCSSSSLISKYRGESEKIVRCLFEAARHCAPSVVFLDEVDALVSSRGVDGEHEASRRLKTEFFSQMDGIESNDVNDSNNLNLVSVMVLATTNWYLYFYILFY
jgi:Cdc6-like AAA superfamily ATPase